jgi:dienelactone hydrolase
MTDKKLSCLEYWRNAFLAAEPSMRFTGRDGKAFGDWQKEFYAKYVECLGPMPKGKVPLAAREIEVVDTAEYVRKKVVYSADEYSDIPAYLFIPKSPKKPSPAIICPHGHGRGKADAAGIGEEDWEKKHLEKYNYAYAAEFAKRGYVTLAPDLRCFGERTDDPARVYGHTAVKEGDHWCDVNFVLGMMLGMNLAALHVFDIERGIDFLQSMKEVDAGRIGCVGLSQGGTTTLFSAAYDKRIKVSGISCYLNSWKSFPLLKGQICGSQIVPGLLHYGDIPEVAGLICPRPVFFEFGRSDPLFPIETSRESYGRVREMYGIAGAPERIDCEEFDGAHMFCGNRIFDFFRAWL